MKTLTTLFLTFFLTLSAGCSVTGQARAADDGYFSQAELDSMLAPVALYPDSVLSHVLIAATYPLEVIQAARWSREHPGLRGEDAVDAVEYQNWDASVKALVAFPELLERMDEDLQWTQNLGDAFLVQEEEVIASIQYLRSEAYSQGHLRSNDRVKVVREREYIYIEPARTRVVYVPYYDPRVIYTNWRWSSYRPHYWHRPSGFSVSVNFHWGRPHYVRPNFYFSSFHWPTRRVVVVNHHHYYNERRFHSGRQVAHFEHARHWKHDPQHRRGVTYRGRVEQTRFVNNDRPASARQAATRERTVARAEQREWAQSKRSSRIDFDRSERSSSRGERVAELRSANRSGERSATAGSRADDRSSSRAALSRDRISATERAGSRSSNRTVSGSAPARAESRGRDAAEVRSASSRSSRLTESLRSSSRSDSRASSSRSSAGRTEPNRATSGRSSNSQRSAAVERSRSKQRSSTSRSYDSSRSSGASRSSSERSSISIPRSLTTRPSSGRSSSPRSSASAPSRSDYSGRSSTPSRSSSTAPRSSGRSAPAPSSRSTPQRRASSSAPSRSSEPAPRSSRSSASSRSSRSSDSGRSGGRGESRRDGRGGEERR